MDSSALLAVVRESLRGITAPRLFETERGYQGALVAELSKRLFALSIAEQGALVEQEYQKRLRDHGLAIRPDIIVHEPFDPLRHASRTEGNHAVFELKHRASAAEARADFDSLLSMMQILSYPLGVFVNIDSDNTHFTHVPDNVPGRLVAFAVSLRNSNIVITETEI